MRIFMEIDVQVLFLDRHQESMGFIVGMHHLGHLFLQVCADSPIAEYGCYFLGVLLETADWLHFPIVM